MSWQATAWAAKQKTGSASNKLTLLALANYADEHGICWPTQETLATDTEQSIDTVQRRIKALVGLGLVRVERRPKGRGQWAGRIYHLTMGVAEMSKPQIAARSSPVEKRAAAPPDHAAPGPTTMPHQARSPCRTAVRHKPPKNLHKNLQQKTSSIVAADRLLAFQRKQEGSEVIQNRIAQRLGDDGWLILGAMSEQQLASLTAMEQRGQLDDDVALAAALRARGGVPP